MPQYQVPQFITVEDKVIGPFTIKQFFYVGGGGLLVVGMYMIFQSFLFWPLAILVGAAAAALAFMKINEQPLPVVLKNFIFYYLRPRLYTWKQEPAKRQEGVSEKKEAGPLIKNIPTLSTSKLTDLAWSLDIKERIKN